MCPVIFGCVDVCNALIVRIVYQTIEAIGSQCSLNASAFTARTDTEPTKLQSRFAQRYLIHCGRHAFVKRLGAAG
jgi:hypothetical protein